MAPSRKRLDVLIVGGGPAGLATALACRARGLAVRVLEPGPAGRDKPCGEGLMPDAVAALRRLGVDLEGAGVAISGIRYLADGREATGRFPARPGLGVRRTTLHRRLWEAASAAGVEIVPLRATGLERAAEDRWRVRVEAGPIEAAVVVGADGLRSPCRSWAGLGRATRPRRARFGVRRHYALAPWSDRVDVHWSGGVEAYVTPVADDLVGVALLWTDPPVSGAPASADKPVFDHLLRRFPELEARLGAAEPASEAAGCGPLRQVARAAVSGNLALVGDAAGYLDAITGEGLAVAFAEAEALGDAVASGDLARYERARRRIVRRPEAITRLALLLSRRPPLLRRTLRAFARDPALFDRMLALHVGERRGSTLGLAAALAARML